MKTKQFNSIVDERIAYIKASLKSKGNEYAPNDDRLENFRVAANLNGQSMAQALWGMATKHIVSVATMVVSRKRYPKAVWVEKLGDCINYMILLYAVVIEEAKEKKA